MLHGSRRPHRDGSVAETPGGGCPRSHPTALHSRSRVIRRGEIFGWLQRLEDEGKIRGVRREHRNGRRSTPLSGTGRPEFVANHLQPVPPETGGGSALPESQGKGRRHHRSSTPGERLAQRQDGQKDTAFPENDHRLYQSRRPEIQRGRDLCAGLPYEKGVELADALRPNSCRRAPAWPNGRNVGFWTTTPSPWRSPVPAARRRPPKTPPCRMLPPLSHPKSTKRWRRFYREEVAPNTSADLTNGERPLPGTREKVRPFRRAALASSCARRWRCRSAMSWLTRRRERPSTRRDGWAAALVAILLINRIMSPSHGASSMSAANHCAGPTRCRCICATGLRSRSSSPWSNRGADRLRTRLFLGT